ncbi:hypothetical protein APT63_10110 [Pseudomonas sp. 22-AL-CL-001]|jgi:hypothetical protein|nr:hypothetical protein APT63_10110 [Pseudomonas monteilii]
MFSVRDIVDSLGLAKGDGDLKVLEPLERDWEEGVDLSNERLTGGDALMGEGQIFDDRLSRKKPM